MITLKRISVATILFVAMSGGAQAASIDEAVENSIRGDSNLERDAARKPADMLGFISLQDGDVVLDHGSGGGYWAELFSGVVGDN